MIDFTIAGTAYQAESGMTWGEWVESSYNVDNYVIGRYNQVAEDTTTEQGVIYAKTGTFVKLTDTIIANYSFYSYSVEQ